MAKMTAADWVKRLKYLEANRNTFYSNSFPANCGYIYSGGTQSYDCIGMVKSVINEPDIVYKYSPVGYYVRPAQVIPDTTEIGILNLCTDVSYSFNNITAGEYLYYSGGGHGAVYVGDFTDPSGVVNTIECTPAFGGGVTTSYCDSAGRRWSHRGGYQVGRWAAHGKLSRYIDYGKPQPQPTPTGKITVDGEWGSSTTKLMQQILKTTVDGIVSNQDSDCRKYCLNCVAYGLPFGSWQWNDSSGYSPLIAELQKKIGARTDGKFGADSIKKLQTFLNNTMKANLEVDGYCGYNTVTALQKWLNSQVK